MSQSASPPALQDKLVLLIDDDPVLLKTIGQWFLLAGCTVMTAADGDIGLRKFRQIRPDLVITDIIMPDREGVETIMAMKAADASVPILAISGGGRVGADEFLSLALSLGADAAMPKPFRNKDLLDRAGQLLATAAGSP